MKKKRHPGEYDQPWLIYILAFSATSHLASIASSWKLHQTHAFISSNAYEKGVMRVERGVIGIWKQV